jgi:hypothetical protein
MIEKFQLFSINKFGKNIYSQLKYDLHQENLLLRQRIDTLQKQTDTLSADLLRLRTHLLLNDLRIFTQQPEAQLYKDELQHIATHPDEIIFPYPLIKRMDTATGGYDRQWQLPYVLHNGKKLYFPETFNEKGAIATYRNFIENENLLGGHYREKAPHRYESDAVCVQAGDVVIDVGSAEGLFALHVIEKAAKVYLIESDPVWFKPLHATFEPYKEKVIWVEKLISDKESDQSVTLSSIIRKEATASLFIKMDIEGYETTVLQEAKAALAERNDIQLACCSYHRQNDAAILEKFFTDIRYTTEFSEGYMLFVYDQLAAPYFRKGMIRAKKKA